MSMEEIIRARMKELGIVLLSPQAVAADIAQALTQAGYGKVAPGSDEPSRSGWQPIETAPKDGMEILVGVADGWDGPPFYSQGDRWAAWWHEGRWRVHGLEDDEAMPTFLDKNITHWMPLPPAPEGE